MKTILLTVLFFLGVITCKSQRLYTCTFKYSSTGAQYTNAIGTFDGGILAMAQASDPSGIHMVFVKLDANGDTSWTNILSGFAYYSRPKLKSLSGQNGYIITGTTYDPSSPGLGLLCKLDINGNIQWARSYSPDTSYEFTIDDAIVTDAD